MPPSSTRQFAVEVHPPEWHFPSGQSWLAGWFYAGEHNFLTDIRAWVDDRVFLGLPGIPKPGLDEKFIGRPGPPYSGFVIRVEPHKGARKIRIEARDPAGHWTEFFRTDITMENAVPPLAPIDPIVTRLPDLISQTLSLHAQRPHTPWSVLANEVVSSAIAEPLNSLPVPPFHGALEEPREIGWLGFGRLAVTGWLAHRTEKIVRVTALVDAVQESILLHGLPREDIGEVFADLPDRDKSQFVGHVDLPANQSSPALIKVFAELANGEKHLVFAQRFVPHVIAGADIALPPLSRLTFTQTLWALRKALRRHNIPLGDSSQLVDAVKTAWAKYRAEAPPSKRNRPILHAPESVLPPSKPTRVLITTHNLNFEGAPWFIFELARHLHTQENITVSLLSPQDGPLKQVFIDAGIPVQLVDVHSALEANSAEQFFERLQTSTAEIDWDTVDLMISNTMVTFWAIHAAHKAGKPSLLYVHESSAIRRFFEPILDAALFPVIEDAFHLTDRVVFTANSTRQVFDYLNTRRNFALLPSWVDVSRIESFAAQHDRAALRRKHGLDPEAVLIVNIGSICERKGQHIFIRAIELLQQELRITYPGRKIQFVMVGARPGYYLESLKQDVRLHGIEDTLFLSESGEIFDFYHLADIFACTSFEESFPRVLLESAMFRLPIITTNVNGIAEMLATDEAWIVPPGDRYQLGDAIKQALNAHFAEDTRRADKARASINHRYNEKNSLPLHAALAYGVLAHHRNR